MRIRRWSRIAAHDEGRTPPRQRHKATEPCPVTQVRTAALLLLPPVLLAHMVAVPGGRLAFIGGAGLWDPLYGWVAWHTRSIRWTTASHVLFDALGLGGTIYFTQVQSPRRPGRQSGGRPTAPAVQPTSADVPA